MEKVMGRGYSVPIRGANSGKLQVAGKNSRGKLTIQAAAQSIQYPVFSIPYSVFRLGVQIGW